MQTDLRGRDLITTQEWTREEIDTLLDVAWDLKRKRALGEPHAYLRDKVLAMLFFFTSTRTRVSFEAGMAQLGGHAQFIDSETTRDFTRRYGQKSVRLLDAIPMVSLSASAISSATSTSATWRSQPCARAQYAV
ncbi:MAG: hypothetical protein R3E39_02235 [Anaerolineae bacterium]